MPRPSLEHLRRQLDAGTWIVMFLTLVLFVAALFFKGLTHDLLLEAGVFLVSVKLMILSYKSATTSRSVDLRLSEILSKLEQRERPAPSDERGGIRSGPSAP